MNQTRGPAVDMTGKIPTTPSGLFDKRNTVSQQPSNASEPQIKQTIPVPPAPLAPIDHGPVRTSKEDFPDIFKQQTEMIQHVANVSKQKIDPDEAEVDKLNKALSGDQDKENEEIIKINPEDMKMAEQLIFNGYTECNVEIKNFPGRKFTICSTNAEEIGLIDEIVFEKIRSVKQNEDGSVEMPENAIRSLRNSLFISISYRGVDGKDFSADALCHINTIKRAILKLGELYNTGDLLKSEELKKGIKTAMIKRSNMVKRMPTPLIDFVTNEKYNFDVKMLKIMNEKNIIPLS